jgi:hypothetical protein
MPLALPRSSKPTIVLSILTFAAALLCVSVSSGSNLVAAIGALAVSGFIADLFTAFAHFGFDYVFPEEMPILGPIAREFRDHHEWPTLDPKDYVVNLSKGAYCSLPLSIIVIVLYCVGFHQSGLSFFVLATFLGLSFWGFFFHQIHSYAHMGACLSPDEFKSRVEQISRLSSKAQQVRQFRELFDAVPIPWPIRFLQKCRIILNPEVHNVHHVAFETDFSSVNGWADPLANLILRPIAKRLKEKARPSGL